MVTTLPPEINPAVSQAADGSLAEGVRGPTTGFGMRLADLMGEHRIRTHRQLAEKLRGGAGRFPSVSTVQAVIRGTKPPSPPFVKRLFLAFSIEDREEWLSLAGLEEEVTRAEAEEQRKEDRLVQRFACEMRRLLA